MDIEFDMRRKDRATGGLIDLLGILASAVVVVECIDNSYSTRYSKYASSVGYKVLTMKEFQHE